MTDEISNPGGAIMWLGIRDHLLSQFGALMRSECRGKIYDEGEVSEALARAVAFQEDPYERMLMGRRPDVA